MHYLIFIVLGIAAFFVVAQLIVNSDPARLARGVRFGAGWIFLVCAGLLAFAGRLAFAGMFGFLALLAFRGTLFGASRKSARQSSRVRTSMLEMELDHDSGHMTGTILAGDYEGRMLHELEMAELAELFVAARKAGDQSIDLLESYLDREHEDWEAHPAFAKIRTGGTRTKTAAPGPMSREEAFEVLGLSPGAGEAEIRAAHKALMKKLHPDQGGSSYLAAKLNEAKDLLLAK